MNALPSRPPLRRPRDNGPFFDYVREATREYARRERARLAGLALRKHGFIRGRQSTAEQRWEGEGGSMRECAPRGGRS